MFRDYYAQQMQILLDELVEKYAALEKENAELKEMVRKMTEEKLNQPTGARFG